MLYVLMIFSFNNQIRFNRKELFNLPVGKRDFNSKMRSKLVLFSEELKSKDVQFMKKDFREISLDDFSQETFIYCDPPYLITNATYNENGMWTEIEEKALLKFLDDVFLFFFKLFEISFFVNIFQYDILIHARFLYY